MIKTTTCVTLICDADPGCDWTDEHDGFTPHYESEQAARKSAAEDGWAVDGARDVCPRHAVAAVCAAEGHDWSGWLDCRCEGRVAEHGITGCPQWRSCERDHCWAREERPVVPA
jgi:hypothetical protein